MMTTSKKNKGLKGDERMKNHSIAVKDNQFWAINDVMNQLRFKSKKDIVNYFFDLHEIMTGKKVKDDESFWEGEGV